MRDPFYSLRRLLELRHPYRAVRFKAILVVGGHKQKGESHHMNFTLVDNQHGTLVVAAVDASGAAAALPSDTAASSQDATILTVASNPGFPDQFQVAALKAGTTAVVVTGTNAAGAAISSTFTFAVTGGPATGFTATLINVAP